MPVTINCHYLNNQGRRIPVSDGAIDGRSFLNHCICSSRQCGVHVGSTPRSRKNEPLRAVAPPTAKFAPYWKSPPPRYGGTNGSPNASAAHNKTTNMSRNRLDHNKWSDAESWRSTRGQDSREKWATKGWYTSVDHVMMWLPPVELVVGLLELPIVC